MDFSFRYSEEELMDDPQIPIDVLRATYLDINRANHYLGGDNCILKSVMLLVEENPKKKYSLIDIGCGDGAMLRKIADNFRNRNIEIELLGVDINEKAILLAQESSSKYPEISFKRMDVFKANKLKSDIVIATLTMHHIAEKDISNFLHSLKNISQTGIVINDLHRSRMAYYLFKFFSVIFIKTKIAKNDGLVSIRSGFTKREFENYSRLFPKSQHAINWKWAYRLNWIIRFND
ncbi:methyltransferase domain-containing protein [Kriegella sp. EG-1]|nr:methyltransferase domain-containing protein [Flavobacteriaceae bacterium EG-1]